MPDVRDLYWGSEKERQDLLRDKFPSQFPSIGGGLSSGPSFSKDDIHLMDKIAREAIEAYGITNRKGGDKVNAYEKVSVRNIMTIEYGPMASIEQLVLAQAYFQLVANQVKTNGHEVPRDLQTALDATTRDLNDKLRADRTRQIKAIELQLEQLMSADEKRAKLATELAKLKELVK